MPAFVKTKEDERLWSKAQEIAKEQGHTEDWAYVTGIYKKMKGGKVAEEKIPGGLSKGKKPTDFDQGQLAKGVKVEMEHTTDPDLAQEIAMDHLTEDPKYYQKLEKVEKAATRIALRYLQGCMINDYDRLPGLGSTVTELELSDDGQIVEIGTSDGGSVVLHTDLPEPEPTSSDKCGARRAAESAEQAYQRNTTAIAQALREITQLLKRHAAEFKGPQGHQGKNWGYPGDLSYVLDHLHQVRAFLKGEDH